MRHDIVLNAEAVAKAIGKVRRKPFLICPECRGACWSEADALSHWRGAHAHSRTPLRCLLFGHDSERLKTADDGSISRCHRCGVVTGEDIDGDPRRPGI